ncbi:MAG: aquaporin [Acidobacteria bacterium]|nr:aquaporin [Acidobacteriota bacterium]
METKIHWPEYLIEAFGLGAFLFAACIGTVLLEHPSSPLHNAIDDAFLRRVLMGVAMGITAVLIICSPWGQRSGAHINPAVTFTYWTLGKIGGRDALWYAAAQFAGAAAGVALATLVAGPPLAHEAVHFAATVPGMAGDLTAFAAEVLISALLMATVLTVSNHPQWFRLTPYFAGSLVALFIAFEGPVSGTSMNPARSFAPAIFSGDLASLWIYFAAPVMGMQTGALLYRLWGTVFCAKLHHGNRGRCIFHCRFSQLISTR